MSDYDPSALRSLATRAASSPLGIFPGVGLAAFSGVLQAALEWATSEETYLCGARMVGVAESDARSVLDDVVAERRALGLEVACEDTFQAARSRLYTGEIGREAGVLADYLTKTLIPADMRAAGLRFEWAEER